MKLEQDMIGKLIELTVNGKLLWKDESSNKIEYSAVIRSCKEACTLVIKVENGYTLHSIIPSKAHVLISLNTEEGKALVKSVLTKIYNQKLEDRLANIDKTVDRYLEGIVSVEQVLFGGTK